MPIKCKTGTKPRYRFRKIKGGTQRLAFCNGKVVETKTFKKSSRYNRLKKIVKDFQAEKIDGVLVDVQSANVMVKVRDALKTKKNQERFETAPIEKVAKICWNAVESRRSK